ncbi:unnamed protein product [Clonostachys rosea f. rosea IK726]|uniref:Uncharacterized protein n=2 Tax=Bionectria ochroleuca TaxID=29856 RepID=A0A0B7KJF8_BIOOC|nr:unnamed protein product [Clonostachys rosea f. rosea IK726]
MAVLFRHISERSRLLQRNSSSKMFLVSEFTTAITMSSESTKKAISGFNLIAIGAALIFHALIVVPYCSKGFKNSKGENKCSFRTGQAIRRISVWLAIWFLELCLGSLYYAYVSDRFHSYIGDIKRCIEFFSALYATLAFTSALLAQFELSLEILYQQKGTRDDAKISSMDQPVRYYEIFARTVEVVAVLRFLTSIGTLGGKYHQSVYAISILLDMCISTLFVLAASISFICFVKARPAFQQSFRISPIIPHALSVLRHLVDAIATVETRYQELRSREAPNRVYWEAGRVICVGWSMIACLLIVYTIQAKRSDGIGRHSFTTLPLKS